MKTILTKILKTTLCYKFYNVFYYGYRYIKEYSYISDTFYSDAFKRVLKSYVGVNVRKDWIGRLYGVINPNIDINGKFDFNKTIIEIDGDNTNSNEWVKHWVYKQLQLIANVFKMNQLYDYISMDFKHVGPTNADNFLLVFDITARREFVLHTKSFIRQLIIYSIIILSYFAIITYCF